MSAGRCGTAARLEKLLYKINSSSRTVELITEKLVGGTGRGAKATMHAFTEDVLGLLAKFTVRKIRCKLNVHDLALD